MLLFGIIFDLTVKFNLIFKNYFYIHFSYKQVPKYY